MDYNNMDSEVIESLNLLRPPVKRKPSCDAHRDHIVYNNTDNIVLQDFSSRKFTTVTDKRSFGDSASLILRKTSGGQIFKQYSSVRYTSLYNHTQSVSQRTRTKEKPLIKVTIIPKQGHLGKVLGKPKNVTKTVQSTSSIQENSVPTNNLYLVVAGRKRKKIYEIKTTGSAILYTKPIRDGAFGTINNLVNTLTMEKKRKKDKKGSRDEQNEAHSISESLQYKEHVCTCEPDKIQEPNNQKSGKSKVKVYGRIGLTKNDKYIVKCQATVNDKPVPIISTLEKQSSSSSYVPVYQDNTTSAYQFACMRKGKQNTDNNYNRDFKLQTDFQSNVVQETQMDGDDKYEISKETQSTQVNFNYKPSDNNRVDCDSTYYTKHRVSKCYCIRPVVNNVLNSLTEKDLEFERNNDLKSLQSPVVIISVFPKQDDNLADIIKTCTTSCVEQIQTKREQEQLRIKREHEQVQIKQEQERHDQNTNEIQTKYEHESIKECQENEPKPAKKTRGRSPQSKALKQRKVVESRHVKTSLKKDSLLRSSQKDTKDTSQLNTKKESYKSKKPSPSGSPRPKSPIGNSKSQRTSMSRQNPRPRSPKKVDKGVNTEHLQEKKAIIESYTKKLDEQMSPSITYKGKPPANSFSKVSVNIDSENDYYDVTFHQDERTTDVNVRKTMKDSGAQKNLDDTKKHGSMENYYPNMSRKHGRNYYQSICDNPSNDDISILNDTPRLSPRDSLEVSHRREDKIFKIPQACRPSTSAKLAENSDFMECSAPDKHYPGDDCDIGDPIKRDREIRLLLGVEARRHKSIIRHVDEIQCHDYEIGNLGLRRCFSKQRETPIIIPPSYNILNSTNVNRTHPNTTKSKPALYSDTYEHVESRKRVEPQTKQNENPCKHSTMNMKSNKILKLTQPHQPSSQNDDPVENNLSILKFKNTVESKQSKRKKETKSFIEQTRQNDIQMKIKTIESEAKENKQSKTVRNTNELFQCQNQQQQLNLNRNIKVFSQVKPFSYQKPIVLSRMQYSKVRKTIQSTVVSGKDNKTRFKKRSLVSIGLVRGMPKKNVHTYFSKEVQTQPIEFEIKPTLDAEKSLKYTLKETNEKETIILFSRKVPRMVKAIPRDDLTRPVVSSVHIRYASMEYSKDITFSSTNEGSLMSSTQRSQPTIETLFKQHRRSPTPNLGTSALSLLSTEAIRSDSRVKLSSPDVKAKKSFLKRLMSCLVMRSSATAKADPPSTPTIMDSSIDSYHISTAFGAIEMTSSIYDTTASFYSNHSIHPLSSKLKRGGFFSSVIGLITNRKS